MLNRLLRPQASLRAVSSISQKPVSAALPRFQTRQLHKVPQLVNESRFREHGVSDFLSPEAYDFAWVQYQRFLVDKLNLLTQDTIDADLTPGDLLVKYSRRAEMASVFNYASMAHNNHFFFNCLSNAPTEMSPGFVKTIGDSCSSVESLKLDFLATANAMFGPGFVWLAKNLEHEGLLHIFCTYNAGSPYPAAHARRQAQDMATHTPETALGNQYAGSMGVNSSNHKMAPGALDIQPILCVNTWEHVWMMDYGIAGKAEFLERWWDRINWDVVQENYKSAAPRRGWAASGSAFQSHSQFPTQFPAQS
ncbi:Manganese/iron superoxide dismutase [Aspergillus karnatakaensis]|uniref:mitochondrial 37S ribosomal protein mS42 n=1 Tax=Aspergillus karnatakaensis TaxID=1810916 RepID=UPI003CCCA1D2